MMVKLRRKDQRKEPSQRTATIKKEKPMPQFRTLTAEEAASITKKASSALDLAPYKEFLRDLGVGTWGRIDPESDEETYGKTRRRVKGAADAMNFAVTMRRAEKGAEAMLVRVDGTKPAQAAAEAEGEATEPQQSRRRGEPVGAAAE